HAPSRSGSRNSCHSGKRCGRHPAGRIQPLPKPAFPSPAGRLDWHPEKTDDRLVIFTERIETLNFLRKHLEQDLKLKPAQIATLSGPETDDAKLQETVLKFGQEREPVRVLIATDIASEGINLHFFAHKLIHFDIPWSLMVFQQRNGRIDRYGQK